MAIEGDWQQDANGQGNPHCTSYPLVVIVGWQRWGVAAVAAKE